MVSIKIWLPIQIVWKNNLTHHISKNDILGPYLVVKGPYLVEVDGSDDESPASDVSAIR